MEDEEAEFVKYLVEEIYLVSEDKGKVELKDFSLTFVAKAEEGAVSKFVQTVFFPYSDAALAIIFITNQQAFRAVEQYLDIVKLADS